MCIPSRLLFVLPLALAIGGSSAVAWAKGVWVTGSVVQAGNDGRKLEGITVVVSESDGGTPKASPLTDSKGTFKVQVDTSAEIVWCSVAPDGYVPLRRQAFVRGNEADAGSFRLEAQVEVAKPSLAIVYEKDKTGVMVQGALLAFTVATKSDLPLTLTRISLDGTIGTNGPRCGNPGTPITLKLDSKVRIASGPLPDVRSGQVTFTALPDDPRNLVRTGPIQLRGQWERCGGGDYSIDVAAPLTPLSKQPPRVFRIWLPGQFNLENASGPSRSLSIGPCGPGEPCTETLHLRVQVGDASVFVAPSISVRTLVTARSSPRVH